ncbi:MAG TPA: sigma-70 family RNA polymerase sigma factor [Firmicutes bacterium]|nr:sigma-70 family RNA polymerase sigma factor [Bacillota bacterium]
MKLQENREDTRSLEGLVLENLGLVKALVKRMAHFGQEEDLVQVGIIGLIKALKGFDPNRGAAFSTFAVPVIIGELKEYLRKDNLIKVSRSMQGKDALLRATRSKLFKKTGQEPTLEALATASGLSKEEIIFIIEYNQPVFFDQETAADYAAAAGGDNILDRIMLKDSLKSLPKVERQLIFFRYFREMTQAETAQKLRLNQVKISRLERKILRKLHAMLNP